MRSRAFITLTIVSALFAALLPAQGTARPAQAGPAQSVWVCMFICTGATIIPMRHVPGRWLTGGALERSRRARL